MEIVPPTPKQQPPLRNKLRGAAYGVVAGLVVGAIGASWEALLTAVIAGAFIGFKLVSGLWPEPPVSWWWRSR